MQYTGYTVPQQRHSDEDLEQFRGNFVSSSPVVYFIQAGEGGPIKIGKSKWSGLRARMCSIQTGCPWPLKLRRVIEGTGFHERELHDHFAKYRLVGEWFLNAPEVAAAAHAVPIAEGSSPTLIAELHHAYSKGYRDGQRAGEAEMYNRLTFDVLDRLRRWSHVMDEENGTMADEMGEFLRPARLLLVDHDEERREAA